MPPCVWPLWLPLALSLPDCGAGDPGTDADLELLEPDAEAVLSALREADALGVEALEEELEEDELDEEDGLCAEGELDDELELGLEELEEDDELDGIEGDELCEDC